MFQAKDVMTRNIIAIQVDATVGDAIATLVEHQISGAPVVDDEQRLVGIISQFQLLETIYSPEVAYYQVSRIMTKNVMTVTETTTVSEITNFFILHRIRRLPVVRDDRVVGIVSRHDLLRLVDDTRVALRCAPNGAMVGGEA